MMKEEEISKEDNQKDNRRSEYAGSSLILLQDSVLSLVASLLAVLLARWLSDPVPGFTTFALKWLGISLVASLAGFFSTGSFKSVRRYLTLNSVALLIAATVIKEIILGVLLLFGAVRFPSVPLAVMAVVVDAVLTASMLFYMRFAAKMFSGSGAKTVMAKVSRKNALVDGTDDDAVALADSLEASGEYNVLGYMCQDRNMGGRVINDKVVYCCATPKDLETLKWRLGGVDAIFFTKGTVNMPKDNPGSGTSGTEASESGNACPENSSQLEDIPVADGMSRFGAVLKRTFDIVLSAVLMVVFSPMALVSAIAVWWEDKGPVLYRQERIGKNGKPFNILKFRSMRVDAEANGAQLYSGDSDTRLTRVGRFLRNHHLDELPQLWNVFVGDMSFIGYRPERQHYIDQIVACNPRYVYLYQIRPGVTSYATLYNGYTDTLEKMLTRLDLDLYYLRNHSVLFDLNVLALTFLNIVFGKRF